jgi:hypothetical protein
VGLVKDIKSFVESIDVFQKVRVLEPRRLLDIYFLL